MPKRFIPLEVKKMSTVLSNERNIVLTGLCLRTLAGTHFKRPESLTLWTLANRLPLGGDIVSSTDLGVELGIDQSHVAKALKFLSEKGFLMRKTKVGSSRIYQLNPAYFRVLV